MAVDVPINGDVLTWAIGEAGHTFESLANALDVPLGNLVAWREQTAAPSASELAKLSSKLRRPSAVFLLPEPPATPSIAAAFRSAPGTESRDELSPKESMAIRETRRRQRLASDLLGESDAAPIQLPTFETSSPPERAAERLREWLGVPVAEQLEWESGSVALARWRGAMEEQGLLVFMLALGADSMRGFSFADRYAPLVAANTTGYSPPARIFTWWHELAHLALGGGGFCERYYFTTGAQIERWCERVAAAVLLPRQAVLDEVQREFSLIPGSSSAGVDEASWTARRFHASLTAAAIRLINLELAPEHLYDEVRSGAGPSKSDGGGGGEHRPEARLRELGPRYTGLIVDGLANGRIPLHDAVDHLRIHVSEVPRLGDLLAEQSDS